MPLRQQALNLMVMKKIKFFLSFLVAIGLVSLLGNCTKEKDALSPLRIVSAATDLGVNLNGAANATSIPLNASVVIVFDKNVDTTLTNLNFISIKAEGVDVPTNKLVNGTTVTLKPTSNLTTGTNETVFISSSLKAMDGATSTATDFTFQTFGRTSVVPPQADNQLSYFSFSGDMRDEVGTHTPDTVDVRHLKFGEDRFGFAGMAGEFDGTTSIVEIPDGQQYMKDKDFTISVWIKASSTKNGHFVLGLAAWKGFHLELAGDWSSIKLTTQYAEAGGASDSEDNWFPGTGETNQNTGWQGWTFQKDVLPHGGGVGTFYFKDKWAQIVCTYDATAKLATMYLNGEEVKQHDFNLWPDGDPKRTITGVKFAGNLAGGGNKLALGFLQGSQNRIITDSWADPSDLYSNHFKGLMDDVRIFKVALTASEVATLYAAEMP